MDNVIIIGGGGREAAIAQKLSESKEIDNLYVLPGNDGMKSFAKVVNITDFDEIVEFSLKNSIDFAVVAPDNPLVDGLVDILESNNIKCFGPVKRAALIEGSKAFSKDFMKRNNIPTANYEIFDDCSKALSYIETSDFPCVIKADGLALGKGVIIAENKEEAIKAISSMMEDSKFGASGKTVVIEEFLRGPEVTVLCFCDGETIVPMISSMDHKRAFDDDLGLNTGGMGVIAPNPFYTKEIENYCIENIFQPTVEALKAEDREFKGCLYFGLMLTTSGAKVIEYNCRFGDPETQAILPLLESDLYSIFKSIREGKLDKKQVQFSSKFSCNVVLASKGYPQKYEKGKKIIIEDTPSNIFMAGVKEVDSNLVTNGGRVLSVTETADSLDKAIRKAYESISKIHFEGSFYRKDIGKKALMVKNNG